MAKIKENPEKSENLQKSRKIPKIREN